MIWMSLGDYWQLGYNTPRIKDLQDFYYYQYSHDNPFELNYSGREQRLPIKSDFRWSAMEEWTVWDWIILTTLSDS
jgi:hypothetical protein